MHSAFMINAARNIIGHFDPISLEQMDSVQLMNRVDAKYIFPVCRMPLLLKGAKSHYRVLEIDGQRDFPYSTTYLDTSNFFFYGQQATGKLKRHKIRYRTYESTGISFLEVKCKTNKKRTIKWRIENRLMDYGFDDQAATFLKSHIPDEFENLFPVIRNQFNRITLVNIKNGERVTLDHSLSFSDWNGKQWELPYLAIAELKRDSYDNTSFFAGLLKQFTIRQNGFSKYGIGMSGLYNLHGRNAFKSKFLLLKKIEHEHVDHCTGKSPVCGIGII
jgi:hypothetical protein